jgi:hypothetical protein
MESTIENPLFARELVGIGRVSCRRWGRKHSTTYPDHGVEYTGDMAVTTPAVIANKAPLHPPQLYRKPPASESRLEGDGRTISGGKRPF